MGNRSDASENTTVVARAARAQPDLSVAPADCAAGDFRGTFFCDLQR